MTFNSIEELRGIGFQGFNTIEQLFYGNITVPCERGNYMILYNGTNEPEFIPKGPGGFFRRDPNVPILKLQSRWVPNTIVLYIGEAGGIKKGKWSNGTLTERLCAYMKFGQGWNIGHYGGRLIWQIKDYKNLVVCWVEWPNKSKDPRQFEKNLIQQFKQVHGKRPFANLKD